MTYVIFEKNHPYVCAFTFFFLMKYEREIERNDNI